jgi:sucrose-6-phosphate hydrolase SacC (GH32 family)
MSLPVELTLRTFREGVRLCTKAVAEVDTLHAGKLSFNGPLKPGENPLASISGDLFDIQLKVEGKAASAITLNIRGTPVVYDFKSKRLAAMGASAIVEPVDGCIDLRLLVDRSSIEIFTADGRVNMAYCFLPPENDRSLEIRAEGAEATIRTLDVWKMKSAWPVK